MMQPWTFLRRKLGALARALIAAAILAMPAPALAKTVAFVVQKAAAEAPRQSDALVKARLEQLGYTVEVLDQADPASDAAAADAVIISSSVSAHKLEGKYRDYPKPLLVWESYELPHLGMSGLKENGDFGTQEHTRYAWMVNAPHPLAAGLPAGLVNLYGRNAAMNWGKPGLGASIIATIPGEPDKALEFTYEKGATMDYQNIAPARRTFIFLDATFGNLNEAGLKLFDAAARWTIGAP